MTLEVAGLKGQMMVVEDSQRTQGLIRRHIDPSVLIHTAATENGAHEQLANVDMQHLPFFGFVLDRNLAPGDGINVYRKLREKFPEKNDPHLFFLFHSDEDGLDQEIDRLKAECQDGRIHYVRKGEWRQFKQKVAELINRSQRLLTARRMKPMPSEKFNIQAGRNPQ